MSKSPPPKRMKASKIVPLLPRRMAGQLSVQPALDEEALDFHAQEVLQARRAVELLTPRQLQVLRGVVRGDSSKQIARNLSLSPRTVELHRRSMMLRLGARTTAAAVRIGVYAGVDWLG